MSPGIALNIGIALGYHVDGQRLNIPPLETELRRRCWAGLKMLYAIQASTFGLIDTGRLADDQVKLPLDVDDVDIHPDGVYVKSKKPTEMTYDAAFVPLFLGSRSLTIACAGICCTSSVFTNSLLKFASTSLSLLTRRPMMY
jgi:hypothetical protein